MRHSRRLLAFPIAGLLGVILFWILSGTAGHPPYPRSRVIEGIEFDFQSQQRNAIGSDNFPLTWGMDDHQYTVWGDGEGFHGSIRRSLGVARIEGDFPEHLGVNLFGASEPKGPAAAARPTLAGKSYGIVDIGGRLYMWVSPLSNANNYEEARLAYSHDSGHNWTFAEWAFTQADGIIIPTIAQFGRGYSSARDQYVYSYFIRLKSPAKLQVQKPGQVDLLRVPQDQIVQRQAYEFFAGRDADGQPRWSTRLADRQPVFQDSNGVGWNLSVSYNPALGRYLLSTEHGRSFESKLGIFEAPEPWGPWSTVAYLDDWGGYGRRGGRFFYWNFSNKWSSQDGTRFVLAATGCCDEEISHAFNAVPGRFILAETGEDADPSQPPKLP